MTWFRPWNRSDDIPEDNIVNTNANFANFSNPFLFLEGRLSSWHHKRLVAEGWELIAAPVTVPANRASPSPGSAFPAWPGCVCAMSQGQLSATAQCSLRSCFFTQLEPVLSGLCCRAELSRTGKLCAAGALLITVLEEPSWVCALPVPEWGLLMTFTGVPLVRGCWQTLSQKEQ